MLKRWGFLFFVFILCFISAFAQNTAPAVNNPSVASVPAKAEASKNTQPAVEQGKNINPQNTAAQMSPQQYGQDYCLEKCKGEYKKIKDTCAENCTKGEIKLMDKCFQVCETVDSAASSECKTKCGGGK